MAEKKGCKNTDIEIWRRVKGDFYSPSIFVTKDGKGIGMDCGGTVYVKPIEEWHKLAGGQINLMTKPKKQQLHIPENRYFKANEILRTIETFYFTKYGDEAAREIDRPKLVNEIAELLPKEPKKQQYIFVARDLKTNGRERAYKKSDVRMVLNSDRYIVNKDFCSEPDESYKPFYVINLKKGEQKRIPVPVELAERV